MKHKIVSLAASSIFVMSQACNTVQVPPPKAPDKSIPQLDDMPADAPPGGASRVIIDTPGEKAQVTEVLDVSQGIASSGGHTAYATVVTSKRLCVTPCVVDLARGSHSLVFASTTDETRLSADQIEVGGAPKVVKHAIGSQKEWPVTRSLGVTSVGLGITGLVLGGIFYGIGSSNNSGSGLTDVGTYSLIGGGALTALGAVLLFVSRPEVQPGATTEWNLGAPPPGGTPVGAGFKTATAHPASISF
jgi:hypothetical protein